MKKIIFFLVVISNLTLLSLTIHAQADAAIIVANDNKNFAVELDKYAQQIATLQQSLEQLKSILETTRQTFSQLNIVRQALGEGSKIIRDFQSMLMDNELEKTTDELKNFKNSCENLFEEYDPTTSTLKENEDSIKKYQSLNDMKTMTDAIVQQLEARKQEIYTTLKQLGEDAGNASTDIETQKIHTIASVQSANLQAIQAQEQRAHEAIVEHYIMNQNSKDMEKDYKDEEYMQAMYEQSLDIKINYDDFRSKQINNMW